MCLFENGIQYVKTSRNLGTSLVFGRISKLLAVLVVLKGQTSIIPLFWNSGLSECQTWKLPLECFQCHIATVCNHRSCLKETDRQKQRYFSRLSRRTASSWSHVDAVAEKRAVLKDHRLQKASGCKWIFPGYGWLQGASIWIQLPIHYHLQQYSLQEVALQVASQARTCSRISGSPASDTRPRDWNCAMLLYCSLGMVGRSSSAAPTVMQHQCFVLNEA